MTTSAVSKKSDPVAPVCLLLAELLSREIDEPMLKMLRLPEVCGVLETAVPEIGNLLEENWDQARYEEHAVEFCRLFIYPAVCKPFAERWAQNGEEEDFSVRRWFEEGEVPEFPSRIAELPDHHIAKILFVRAGIADAESSTKADYHCQMIRPWAEPFANALGTESQLDIYRSTAAIMASLNLL